MNEDTYVHFEIAVVGVFFDILSIFHQNFPFRVHSESCGKMRRPCACAGILRSHGVTSGGAPAGGEKLYYRQSFHKDLTR